jgi:hypothetical protein
MLGGADGVEREYILCGPVGGDWAVCGRGPGV